MMQDVQIIASPEPRQWRSFVNAHPQGNIFQTPEMSQVFERAHGCQPCTQAALDREGRLLALLPAVQVTLMNGPLRRLTTRSILYGGALCTPDSQGLQALELLLQAYAQDAGRQALFTEMRHLADPGLARGSLERSGYVFEGHLNYLIDLCCSPDEVLGRIGARTRKHIRQALRRDDVRVEQFDDKTLLPAWYGLVRKSYAAARVPLADLSLFENAFDLLQPLGMAQFWLARIGEIPVAASVELAYKDTLYGWYSGVDRAYAAECPGEVLMWRVLERACLDGYKTYDFGGAGRPDEEYGVRSFKAKFGGALVNFGRHRKVHAPGLLKLSELGYGVYRRIKELDVRAWEKRRPQVEIRG